MRLKVVATFKKSNLLRIESHLSCRRLNQHHIIKPDWLRLSECVDFIDGNYVRSNT